MPSRRVVNWFLGSTAGALFASIFYPVLRFLSPPAVPESTTNQVEAGLTNDPELVQKGFKIVRFGNEPVILIKVAENDYRAFSATCTHLDCIVEFQKDKERIWCNCHNGEYNLHGVPVAGPPPRPLQSFQVDVVSRGSGPERTIVVSRT
jgi:cytochrome b6-f complex iron-sulfur subunit